MTEGSARSPPGARSQPDAQHHLGTGQRARRCSGGWDARLREQNFFSFFSFHHYFSLPLPVSSRNKTVWWHTLEQNE